MSDIKRPIKIALLQHTPEPDDIPAALARLDHYAGQASVDGCSLLLVPEASITGYNIPKPTMQKLALTSDGETSNAIAALCRKHDMSIAFGYAEKDGSNFYNAVQLIDQRGKRQAHYRKTHLWGELDRTLFSAGESLGCGIESVVATVNGWNIGLLICYDIEFPEACRHLSLAGADLVLTPTGLMQPWREVPEKVVPVRAYENQVFIAYANYCGDEGELTYEGRSCIVGPDGHDLARAGQHPVLLTATLDPALMTQARTALPYHRDRRPELYSLK